jgi:WD40 repeat protein
MKLALLIVPAGWWLALAAGSVTAQDAAAQPVAPEADRKAAAWVLEYGGRVGIDPAEGERRTVQPGEQLPSGSWRLTRIDLWSCRDVTDADADRLGGLDALEQLGLSYTRVGDRAVQTAAALPNLKGLYLAGTSVSDEGIAPLSAAKGLRSLDLSGTRITDAGLAALDLKSRPIEDLFLSRTKVTAAGLAALGERPDLKTLHIVGLELGEDGRKTLGGFTALVELAVTAKPEDVAAIAAVPTLRSLFVYGEDVTDAALDPLREAEHLERIFLGGTSVSATAAAELDAALADCRVSGYPWKRRSAFLDRADVIRWEPGPETSWRGLAARPAVLPGIKRWQVETIHPRSEITAIAFSPDGQTIACGTAIGYLRLYDAATLELRRIIPAIDRGVLALAWRPDGKSIVCGGHARQVRCFAPDGSPMWSADVPSGPVTSVSWKADGTTLAASSWDGSACLFDPDGKAGPVIKTGISSVLAVAWQPGGELLAAGTANAALTLWKADGTLAGRMTGQNGRITAMAWKPDGKTLFTGSNGGEIRAWSADGRLQKVFAAGTQEVTDIAWHPRGTELAVCSGNQATVFGPDGQELRKLSRQKDWVASVAYSPDGGEIATGNRADAALKVWGPEGTVKRQIGVLPASLQGLAWHPRSTMLATVGNWQPARLWGADGKPGPAMNVGQDSHSAAFHPDGKLLATGGWQVVWIWNTDGTPEFTSPQLEHMTQPAAWSPDGDVLATAHGGGLLRFWQPDGKELRKLEGTGAAIRAMDWSPDGKLLATIAGDGATRLWPDGKAPARVLTQHGSGGNAVCWSPDGKWIASGGWSGELWLHAPDGTAGPAFPIQNGIVAADWDPNGKHIAVGCHSRGVVILDTEGQIRHEIRMHGGTLRGVEWSPDGRHLATIAWDATLRVWNGDTFAPEWTTVLLPNETPAVFTPAGQLLHGNPAELATHLVYLVEPESGPMEMLSPAEFDARLDGGTETVASSNNPTR